MTLQDRELQKEHGSFSIWMLLQGKEEEEEEEGKEREQEEEGQEGEEQEEEEQRTVSHSPCELLIFRLLCGTDWPMLQTRKQVQRARLACIISQKLISKITEGSPVEGELMLPHGAQSPQAQDPWTLPEAAHRCCARPAILLLQVTPTPCLFPQQVHCSSSELLQHCQNR